MNPCPCGHYPDVTKCTCSPQKVKNYLNRISKPLLDRIDINIEATPIKYEELQSGSKGESSKDIRKRILEAQRIQKRRFGNKISFNAQMGKNEIEEFC